MIAKLINLYTLWSAMVLLTAWLIHWLGSVAWDASTEWSEKK